MRALILAAGLAVGPILPAAAQMNGHDIPFALLDQQHTGRVTFEQYRGTVLKLVEHKGGRPAQFAQNHPAAFDTMLKKRFDAIDTKKQGYIDAEEWANRPRN